MHGGSPPSGRSTWTPSTRPPARLRHDNTAVIALIRRSRKGARGGSARAVKRAIQATLDHEDAHHRDVSLLLTDDREIRTLNHKFRGFDKPTDVLSFPLDTEDGELGDVIISVERARAQAKGRKTTLDQELELLAVHGTLHLLGYDHQDPEEARAMRKTTRTIRRRLAKDG